jgi:hypothetical protein
MRLPRFRLRTLMVAVAVMGLGFGMVGRRAYFQRIANDHEIRIGEDSSEGNFIRYVSPTGETLFEAPLLFIIEKAEA